MRSHGHGFRGRAIPIVLLVGAMLIGLAAQSAQAAPSITEYPIPTPDSRLAGITAGPDGNLWFTENNGNKIGRITPAGVITEFPFATPSKCTTTGELASSIVAGPDGNLWFQTRCGVGRITPAGTITLFKQFGDGESGDRANGITVGPDGNLWFTAARGIGRSTPDGVITLFEIPGIALAITRGPDGNLWFGMFTVGEIRIGRISPAGAIAYYPLTTRGLVEGITAGPDGNLWFTQAGANEPGRIGRITPSGTITLFTPSRPLVPYGITSAPDGALWFATGRGVGRVTSDGTTTEFSSPNGGGPGIAVGPDGALWFTQRKNRIGRLVPESGPAPSPAPTPAPGGAPAALQGDPLSFPAGTTPFTVAGAFRVQWEQRGGLAINGYPLSEVFLQRLEDGTSYWVQYFERVRMEYHPEVADPLYQVQLGQFGRRLHPLDPPAAPQPGAAYFPETQHNVSGGFLSYWQANGDLAQFGFPLSEVFKERLEDGNEYDVQYFERARFEYHGPTVLLGQFGRRVLAETPR